MKNTQDIKTHIIHTTKTLIQKKSSVTIKAIAEASYVNIAAVNYYFGSKDNLMNIVLKKTIDELKQAVFTAIEHFPKDASVASSLETMLTVIYTFALDNMGIIRHMFLIEDTQENATSLLIETFFKPNDFTDRILEKISESTQIADKEALHAKYMLLFSSFSIPLFIQLLQEKDTSDKQIGTLKDPTFRKYYIGELLKIIQ